MDICEVIYSLSFNLEHLLSIRARIIIFIKGAKTNATKHRPIFLVDSGDSSNSTNASQFQKSISHFMEKKKKKKGKKTFIFLVLLFLFVEKSLAPTFWHQQRVQELQSIIQERERKQKPLVCKIRVLHFTCKIRM